VIRCTTCHSEAPDGSHYCPFCSNPLKHSPGDPGDRKTVTSAPRSPSHDSTVPKGRFLPGTSLSDRYRIVSLLGVGGMGEVYRADDLKLGQAVALKFLPEPVGNDSTWLARFYNEVRMARQVTHPNVCRVFDIGEVGGRHFLSMEYVDGEDLASLLRRIGRLPEVKAVQIAREICIGLGAAHDRGILHRDLKPANLMIDGRGRVKITDFGLADLAHLVRGREIRAGTPAYMAPEQLAGREVTARTDIYALGLVLYEMFTGHRVFEADTLEDLIQQQQSSVPEPPSRWVLNLDLNVEKVILRCLAREPDNRPSSPLTVAARMPGGSPLAELLAAGETPSPELVAEAGEAGTLSPPVGWSLLGLFFAGVAAVVWMSGHNQATRVVSIDNPPAVLAKKACDVIDRAGYRDPPTDWTRGFRLDEDLLNLLGITNPDPGMRARLLGGPPSPIRFWYRQSPDHLMPWNHGRLWPSDSDPPLDRPGMIDVRLDPAGNLTRFVVMIGPGGSETAGAVEPDWTEWFEDAGLEVEDFVRSDPRRHPPVYTDARLAWIGHYPGDGVLPLRVEAGSLKGRPVFFEVLPPWMEPAIEPPPGPQESGSGGTLSTNTRTVSARASGILELSWFIVALIGGALIARKNLRLGRGDRRGAFRLALFLFVVRLASWFLAGHHVFQRSELLLFNANLAWGMWYFGLAWIWYIALEPYARRLWPDRMVSWMRALDGRVRDALVGRDLLIGALFGVALSILLRLYQWLPRLLDLPVPRPDRLGVLVRAPYELLVLNRSTNFLPLVLSHLKWALLLGLIGMVLPLVLHMVLRRWVLTTAAVIIVGAFLLNPAAGNIYWDLLFSTIEVALWLIVLYRFGLLAVIAGFFVHFVLVGFPLTVDLSVWYAGRSIFALALTGAIAVYGFYRSQGGRPLFREEILPAGG
jgi:serine/threonine-protein kinase